MTPPIEGFSKLSKEEKIDWIAARFTDNSEETKSILKQYWNPDAELQQLHDEFIENTISNYYLPLGIAPNFLINGKLYAIPMAIEESSVVAAASKAAKFWLDRGGFHAEVLGTEKTGQVHFLFHGDSRELQGFIDGIQPVFRQDALPLTRNMQARGGGINGIELIDKSSLIPGYYQLHCRFQTADAMGANFINSCLEQFAQTLEREAKSSKLQPEVEIIMSILSNYVPGCRVRVTASCPLADLKGDAGLDASAFAGKMVQAVEIANIDPYRAVTHNKGIMNGIDAVVLATGNDFRAVEAGVHAYAARSGTYSSLSFAQVEDGVFSFGMEIPLALGTVGGLTRLHPMVGLSLDILQNPDAETLMQIVAVAGLAQNFAALRSLVTTGIQQGHMKMHLRNILNNISASPSEKKSLLREFSDRPVSQSAVADALEKLRRNK